MVMTTSDRATQPARNQFIALAEHGMSRQEAEERVLAAVQRLDSSVSKSRLKKEGTTIQFTSNGKTTPLRFFELVAEAQRTGIVRELDNDHWRKTEPYGSITVSTNAPLPIVLAMGPHTTDPLHAPGYATTEVVGAILDGCSSRTDIGITADSRSAR